MTRDEPQEEERERRKTLADIRRETEDATARLVQEIQETGALRHLYGKPLDLDDDPEWLVSRVLKKQGFSHPIIERSREIDGPQQEAGAIINRLRRRRRRLVEQQGGYTAEQARAFNITRETAIADYAKKLARLNTVIRDYNLTAPMALHRLPVRVDRELQAARDEIPPLEPPLPAPVRKRRSPWWRRKSSPSAEESPEE